MRILLLIAPLVLSGCGFELGSSDYSEKIGRTGYTFYRTSSSGKTIRPNSLKQCKTECSNIESIVLGYEYNEHVIAAVRQIRDIYDCDEGYLTYDITDEVVFVYIDLSSGLSSGSLSLEKLDEFSDKEEFKNIDFERLRSLENEKREPKKYAVCTNARLFKL